MSSAKQTFFWAVSAKGVQTGLVYAPPASSAEERVLTLTVFDCDGARVNQAEITFPAGSGCVVELDYYLGLMKLESGMRHGLVRVEGEEGGRLLSRYQTPGAVSLVPTHQLFTNIKQELIPVHCGEARRTLIALCNTDESPSQVKGRLIIGKRSPEVTWNLAPMSSRLIELESSFGAAISESGYTFTGRGYLKLSTPSLQGLLAHSVVFEEVIQGESRVAIYQG